MCSKFAIALIAALGVVALTAPPVARAESQSEWLERQLQTSDGYAPPPVLPAQEVDRTAASPMRRGASRPPQAAKSVPRPRRVSQRPASAPETLACQETVAVSEPSPPRAECPDCRVIESKPGVDLHSENIGLAALGVLLLLAGFKVIKTVGAVQAG